MSLFAGTALARFSKLKSMRSHSRTMEPQDTQPPVELLVHEDEDVLECKDDVNLAILMEIRQAVSEATSEHSGNRSVVLNLSFDRSRRSSRHYDYSNLETTTKAAPELFRPCMLDSNLYLSDISSSWSDSRKGSLPLSDYDLSDGNSLSEESEPPISDDIDVLQADDNSGAHTQSSIRKSSIRNRPNFSYRPQGASITQYSQYSYGVTSQYGQQFQEEVDLGFSSMQRMGLTDCAENQAFHDPLYTVSRESAEFIPIQSNTDTSQGSRHSEEAFHDDVALGIDRITTPTPALSIQYTPPITPLSRSRRESLAAGELPNAHEQNGPPPNISSYISKTLLAQKESHNAISRNSSSQLIGQLSRPRRFFRNRTQPRSVPQPSIRIDTTSNAVSFIPPSTSISRDEPTPDPVSPLTPRCSTSDSHFPTIRAMAPEVSETLHPSELQCAPLSTKPFFAGLSFGFSSSKGGIRLASMEKIDERQKILFEKKSPVPERCMHD